MSFETLPHVYTTVGHKKTPIQCNGLFRMMTFISDDFGHMPRGTHEALRMIFSKLRSTTYPTSAWGQVAPYQAAQVEGPGTQNSSSGRVLLLHHAPPSMSQWSAILSTAPARTGHSSAFSVLLVVHDPIAPPLLHQEPTTACTHTCCPWVQETGCHPAGTARPPATCARTAEEAAERSTSLFVHHCAYVNESLVLWHCELVVVSTCTC